MGARVQLSRGISFPLLAAWPAYRVSGKLPHAGLRIKKSRMFFFQKQPGRISRGATQSSLQFWQTIHRIWGQKKHSPIRKMPATNLTISWYGICDSISHPCNVGKTASATIIRFASHKPIPVKLPAVSHQPTALWKETFYSTIFAHWLYLSLTAF